MLRPSHALLLGLATLSLACGEEERALPPDSPETPESRAEPDEPLASVPTIDPVALAAAADLGVSDVSYSVEPDVTPRFERIVLVSIDTLRADHLGCYGYVRDTTPFLDELAAGGTLFRRAFSSVSHTGPSHASMLTGLPPIRHGLLRNGQRLRRSVPTMAGMLSAAGFESAAFLSVTFMKYVARDFGHVKSGSLVDAEEVADRALAWLTEARESPRFFLFLHFYDPHEWKATGKVPEEDLAAVRASTSIGEEELFPYFQELHALSTTPDPFELHLDPGVLTRGFPHKNRGAYVRKMDGYDGQIHRVDRELRRVFAGIEALELPGRTLWIITSDHGEGLGGHRALGHGMNIYNEQMRVPLILFASDGSLARPDVEQLTQHVDLLPTIAATIDAELEGFDVLFDGASLWTLLEGDPDDWPLRPAFAQKRPGEDDPRDTRRVCSLQSDGLKLIRHPAGREELYDLARDPHELEDLGASERAESEDARALRAWLEARLASYSAGEDPAEADAPEEEISEEMLEELRKLGYVR